MTSRVTVRRTMARRALSAAVAAPRAACTVGPNYKRPARRRPDDVPRRRAPRRPSRRSLGDERVGRRCSRTSRCRQLITTALARELRRAASPRRASCRPQAQLGITRADQFPTVDAAQARRRAARRRHRRTRRCRSVGIAQLGGSARPGSSTSGASSGAPPKPRARSSLASEWGRRAIVDQPRQPGRRRATSSCARSIFSSRSRAHARRRARSRCG